MHVKFTVYMAEPKFYELHSCYNVLQ